MNSIKVKIAGIFTIGFLCITLLELGSWAVLQIFTKGNNDVVSDTFVFKPMNEDGIIVPEHNWALPIQENANFNWKGNYGEFDVMVRTNSIGLREDFEVNLSEIKVAFFGDSFTFGHGVNVEERYTNVYAKNTTSLGEKEVVSMSYKNGFQPEHYEYTIRNNLELNPDIYVIGLYLGNDLGADVKETIYNVEENKLYLPYRLIQKKGQMKVNPITLKEPFQFLSKHTYFGTVLTKLIGRTGFRRYLFKNGFEGPNSANSIDLELGNTNLYLNRAMQSVLRINKIAKERKAKLVVLLMAQNFYFGDDNPHANKELINKLNQVRNENNLLRQLNVFCKNNSLICLDPTLVLAREDFFPVDAHWNVNGHRKVGVFLSEQLFK
jgi:hypothetical protein